MTFSGCSSLGSIFEEKDPTVGLTASQLYAQGKEFLDAADFNNAIKLFEILEARYPFGKYSTQAMLDISYAYYASNQKDEAIIEINRFIRLYPNHPNVSYAYYLRALSNFDKDANIISRFFGHDPSRYDVTDLKNSFNDFTTVVNRFPDSKYADDSINRLRYIKNQIARNELYIAKYYDKRSANIAAIERVKYMLENYGGTPSSEEGLVILVKNYNDLKLYDLAYDSARVLKKNFPDYRIIKKDRQVLVIKDIKIKVEDEISEDIENDSSWLNKLNPLNWF
jgi:outer membrane protein assembly factor BamD|tara:strand:+ start:2496 stop:3338 length:843 start_codon:yes stop_codon:yes gene_type:complete